MLSYQADATIRNNPFELGMDRLVDLDMEADFVSKAALKRIRAEGVKQLLVGIEFDGPPIAGSNDENWVISRDGETIGYVTSAAYSPRLEKNIALAMLDIEHAGVGVRAVINLPDEMRNCEVVPKPFYDPNKQITAGSTMGA